MTPQVPNLTLQIPALHGLWLAPRPPGEPWQVENVLLQAMGQWTADGPHGHPGGPAPASQWLWHAAHRGAARCAVDPISAGPDAPARAPTTVRVAWPRDISHTARAAGTVPSGHSTPASGQPSPVSSRLRSLLWSRAHSLRVAMYRRPRSKRSCSTLGRRSTLTCPHSSRSLCRATGPRYALTAWPSPRCCRKRKALSRPGSSSREGDGLGNDVRARSTPR